MTDCFEKLRGTAPDDLLDSLNQMLLLCPETFRDRVNQVVNLLPREGDNWQKVLELVRTQWEDIQSQDWVKIAVVGPSQTGKNALVGAIRRRESPRVRPIFSIVDATGLKEYLGFDSEGHRAGQLENVDIILLVLDGQYGISDATVEMIERLKERNRPILTILNKMDIAENPAARVREARRKLKTRVLGASARQPRSVDKVLAALVATESKALYPLTRNFPWFRQAICNGVITRAALTAGLVGALRIPVSDLLPLTAIQTAMVLKIGRAFGYNLDRQWARELIPMLVAGALVREGAHRLRRRFPRANRILGVSAAGLWTLALGKAAVRYFDRLSSTLQQEMPTGPRLVVESKAG